MTGYINLSCTNDTGSSWENCLRLPSNTTVQNGLLFIRALYIGDGTEDRQPFSEGWSGYIRP